MTIPLACGPDEPICPGGQAVCECACFEKVEPDIGAELTDHVVTRCSDAPLCPEFTLTCGFEANGEVTPCPEVDDLDALACALDALARGAPGRLLWHSNAGLSRYTTLHLAGDGTAFLNEREVLDIYGSWHDLTRSRLQAPAYFEACAAAATVEGRTACLRAPFAGPAEELCVPEFGYNSLHLPE